MQIRNLKCLLDIGQAKLSVYSLGNRFGICQPIMVFRVLELSEITCGEGSCFRRLSPGALQHSELGKIRTNQLVRTESRALGLATWKSLVSFKRIVSLEWWG